MWIQNGVAVAGVAGAALCIFTMAGICFVGAIAVLAIDAASNAYGAWKHEMSWRDFAISFTVDTAAVALPGVRAFKGAKMGLHTPRSLAIQREVGGRSVMQGMKNLPLKKAFKHYPVRSAGRTAANLYLAHHSARGRWFRW